MPILREIILDTETTGLSPKNGDRIIEIGCVEMIDKRLTGRYFHHYVNPERDIPFGATKVHGITNAQVADKPLFRHVANEFLEFIKDGTLVIHNAPFDTGFLNHELERASLSNLRRIKVVDTVMMARKKFPGSPANLDALCRRYGVNLDRRDKHGALLDANLLAEVYVHLCGGPQAVMFADPSAVKNAPSLKAEKKPRLMPLEGGRRSLPPTEEEERLHADFLKKIKDPLWTA
ncbi:MAG: DNA polymerase III subunit epsilon [Rickettsiales bacterium]